MVTSVDMQLFGSGVALVGQHKQHLHVQALMSTYVHAWLLMEAGLCTSLAA
jgi:hypothetical protein